MAATKLTQFWRRDVIGW